MLRKNILLNFRKPEKDKILKHLKEHHIDFQKTWTIQTLTSTIGENCEKELK